MLHTCISNSSSIDCFFETLQNWRITETSICDVYTMHIHGICHVYKYVSYIVLKVNYAFSGFNIILSSTMTLACSIELRINTWNGNFYINCIYVVYAIHIQLPYIYMEYTWYTPTIYLVGVPDAESGGLPGWRDSIVPWAFSCSTPTPTECSRIS